MNRLIKTSLLATALIALGATPAIAADTVDFNVTVVITTACDVNAAAPTDVNFGAVASTAVNTDNAGAVNVRCTLLTPYSIALNSGQNGASVTERKMKDAGTNLVPYQLYKAATRLAGDVWGSTTGTNLYSGIGTGLVQNVPVYGRVPSANFPAGSYSDVVRATITY